MKIKLKLLDQIVEDMDKNHSCGCVCGNGRGVAQNGYNKEITGIAADAVRFLEKKSHKVF